MQNVGKRCGSKTIRQEEINFLLVARAASGLQVVRLKSGDPLIFGRAGEEIEALRRSNIEYEIVPGVTSALGAAAAAGIPLTHRRVSSTLVLTAGHRASEGTPKRDWSAFAAAESTLVVYMPGSELCARLPAGSSRRGIRDRNSLRNYFPGNNSPAANPPHHGFGSSSCSEARVSDIACCRRGREVRRSEFSEKAA